MSLTTTLESTNPVILNGSLDEFERLRQEAPAHNDVEADSLAIRSLKEQKAAGLSVELKLGAILYSRRGRFERTHGDDAESLFKKFCRDNGFTMPQAEKLISMADLAHRIIHDPSIDLNSSNEIVEKFSPDAFLELSKGISEIVPIACSDEGYVTKQAVRAMNSAIFVSESEILPLEIQEMVGQDLLPAAKVHRLCEAVESLPEEKAQEIIDGIVNSSDGITVEAVERAKKQATDINTINDLAPTLSTLAGDIVGKETPVNLDQAYIEAERLECVPSYARILKKTAEVESLATKLAIAMKALSGLCDRAYVDSEASAPHFRDLIAKVDGTIGTCFLRRQSSKIPLTGGGRMDVVIWEEKDLEGE